jgi:hypothetical protein
VKPLWPPQQLIWGLLTAVPAPQAPTKPVVVAPLVLPVAPELPLLEVAPLPLTPSEVLPVVPEVEPVPEVEAALAEDELPDTELVEPLAPVVEVATEVEDPL